MAPDLFLPASSSDSTSIALQFQQGCLWLFAACPKPNASEASPAIRANTWAAAGSVELAGSPIFAKPSTLQAWGNSDQADSMLIAFKVPQVQSLYHLLEARGPLPKELAEDWAMQIQSQTAASVDSSNLGESPINHWAVFSEDASLINLPRLVEFAAKQTANFTNASPAVELDSQSPCSPNAVRSYLNEQQKKLQEALAAGLPSNQGRTLREVLAAAGATIPTMQAVRMQPSDPAPATSKVLALGNSTSSKPTPNKEPAVPQAKLAWWQDRRVQIGAGAASLGGLVIAGILAFGGDPKQVAQNPKPDNIIDTKAAQATGQVQSDAPENNNSTAEVEELDLAGALPSTSQPEATSDIAGSSALPESMASLGKVADASSLVSGEINLGTLIDEAGADVENGSATDNAKDAALPAMPTTGSEPEMNRDVAAILPKADTKLFDDDEADPIEPTSDSTEPTNTDPADANPAAPNTGIVQRKVSLDKALVKLTLPGPEGLVRNKAASLIHIKPLEGMLMEPSTPFVIVGKETGERTLYRTEEGAAIKVYVRSDPKAAWKFQFATRVRITSAIELPPDAKVLDQSIDQVGRMQVYWANQRSFVNQLRSHPRAIRPNIDAAESMIDAKLAELDDISVRLRDASVLLEAFKAVQDIDVYLASSQDELPEFTQEAQLEKKSD